MAIDTKAERNAALKDACGVLFPGSPLDAADRQTLLGDYLPQQRQAARVVDPQAEVQVLVDEVWLP